MVIACVVGSYYKSGLAPVDMLIEMDDVRAVRGGTGYAKCGGNYAAATRAGEKAAKKGVLGTLVLVFMISSSCKCCPMVGRKNKKPFVAPAGWQKRRKVENPPRYHSSLFPVLETHSTGYHHIPATVTGAPVCIYFQFDAAAVQPVRQLDRAVPRTNRHFSERIALLTTLCHCVLLVAS